MVDPTADTDKSEQKKKKEHRDLLFDQARKIVREMLAKMLAEQEALALTFEDIEKDVLEKTGQQLRKPK